MDVIRSLYKLLPAVAAALFAAATGYATPSPFMEFSAGKVWVKALDAEVLYTFARYNNSTEEWKSVFIISTTETPGVAIDGSYVVMKSAVGFTPRFPFAKGVHYIARFNQEALVKNYNEVYLPDAPTEELRLAFSIEGENGATPHVVAIYPTTDLLPENVLRFHITFSSSMKKGEVYQRVRLLDESGKALDRPFLIVDEELWDDEMRSVTLMMDPGRIKRGLRKNIELGPPLSQGNVYTLEVAQGWPDKDGLRTAETFRKTFRCTGADRKQIDVTEWTVTPPVQQNDPLTMNFHEALDADMASSAFRIKDSNGNIVEGEFYTLVDQSGIRFEPAFPWAIDQYSVEVNPVLEDVAGNNLQRSFDEDTSLEKKAHPATTLTFRFKKGAD
jgi:hypothetical protein